MANGQRQVVRVRLQLCATSTTELWVDLMPFLSTLGITNVRGRIVRCEKTGNFQCRVGVQTHSGDREAPDGPVACTGGGTGVGQIGTVSKNFVDFDPTNANNGNIVAKPEFRLGLLYSSTGATVVRGDVIVELNVNV